MSHEKGFEKIVFILLQQVVCQVDLVFQPRELESAPLCTLIIIVSNFLPLVPQDPDFGNQKSFIAVFLGRCSIFLSLKDVSFISLSSSSLVFHCVQKLFIIIPPITSENKKRELIMKLFSVNVFSKGNCIVLSKLQVSELNIILSQVII